MRKVTFERATELLRYDLCTGILMWRLGRPGASAGAPAGSLVSKNGRQYRVVRLDGRLYPCQVIAWLLMTRRWPKQLVTFKDRDTTNCRWRNLLPITESELRKLTRLQSNNTSGHRGVSYDRVRNKYACYVQVDRRRIFFERFRLKRSAVRARERVARRFGFQN